MFEKLTSLVLVLIMLSGCASGILHIYDADGKVVGECTSGYEWHPYGVEASRDWLLNYCAEMALAECGDNCTVSNPDVIDKDYSLPSPPEGEEWNKKNAWQAFSSGAITETVYGYILAYAENLFYLRVRKARQDLAEGKISQDEFERTEANANSRFEGSN